MTLRFDGNFTQQESIPETGIAAAVAVMESGRLHRYNVADGEEPAVVALEKAFAAYTGARYCLAVTSGGYALQTALRAHGVVAGDGVLTNAFTLAPVPGSIAAVGAKPVLVNTTAELTICLDDLACRIESSGARVLIVSHMRGHIVDMDRLMELTNRAGLAVIEDCAHTMGARWADVPSGRHGIAACYSLQTYKHINTGEGGLIISDDDELMARATILSGSYMLYGRHETVPPEEVFQRVRLHTPNCSGRLDNLRAAIALPQLDALDHQVVRWNARYAAVARELAKSSVIRLPERSQAELFVGSSIQFFIEGLDVSKTREILNTCAERGVELKWFGDPAPVAFTSRYDSWQYMAEQPLPETDAILHSLFDMRIPLTFSEDDCAMIGRIIAEVAVERCG